MAHAYHNLYKINSIGLRFFTVYGPYGRPDMSLNIFAQGIKKGNKIQVFNNGKMVRDFTYVEDVVNSVFRLYIKFSKTKKSTYQIFNIGTTSPVNLKKYVKEISKNLNKKPKIKFAELQIGDVNATISNSNKLYNFIKFKPTTKVEAGINKFINWFNSYYK